MRMVPGVAVAVAILAILPGWLFYYDVTPKAAAVLAAAAMLVVWVGVFPARTQTSETSRLACWNTILAASFAASVAISAAISPYVSLSWLGSNWRRSGAVVLIATLIVAVAGSAVTSRLALLRSICLAGLIAGGYAIAQYFGWDPLLPAAGYHFGEGEYQIVRPPGTMGHSNYLAAVLLWPVFCGVGLYRANGGWLGPASAAVSAVAIVLCGSRGAWAGLAAGCVLLLVLARSPKRIVALGLLAAVVAGAAFYMSPAGERLRARMFWIGEDAAGGARPLLWRDSLRMAAERPVLGYGPESFVAAFPQHQSAELSRAYPDFYHESPHNMFLDTLLGQGIVGLAILIAWIAVAAIAGWRRKSDPLNAALLTALVAALVAHQFVVLVIPTALLLFLTMSSLAGVSVPVPVPRAARWAAIPAAAVLAVIAYQTIATDAKLGRVQRLMNAKETNAGQMTAAADLWGTGIRGAGVSADLYFSRRWAQAAGSAADTVSKLRFAQIAGNAAAAAARDPEQQQNAWYSLAQLEAAANDNAAVEASLRGAIAAAPTWFKPHWTLARLLELSGRTEEARKEARLALDLNGRRDQEVIATMEDILRSGHTVR